MKNQVELRHDYHSGVRNLGLHFIYLLTMVTGLIDNIYLKMLT